MKMQSFKESQLVSLSKIQMANVFGGTDTSTCTCNSSCACGCQSTPEELEFVHEGILTSL